jgi:DNA polymerase-3 subunit alpha/error-prone DNA polymerase
MGQSYSTAWSPGRPNQQLVAAQRSDALRAPAEQRAHDALVDLGLRLRAAFAGAPTPLIAVQTHYSLLEGTASPKAWSTVLGAWLGVTAATPRDRRGGNFPAGVDAVARATALIDESTTVPPADEHTTPPRPDPLPDPLPDPPWALLAERDDLLSLPTAIEHWGRRLMIGATVRFDGVDAVFLAPDAVAYRVLCQLLTARHHGLADDALLMHLPSDEIAALTVLVRCETTGQRFAASGARVWWRADVRPAPGDTPFPAVAVPLLSHIADDRAAAGVLMAMQRRGTVDRHTVGGTALIDLLHMPQSYRGYEEQLARSAALRTQTWYVPSSNTNGRGLHLPPLPPTLRGCDPDTELRRLAEAGIPRRYGHESPDLRQRLEHELRVIADKGFAPYLLTVWSIAHKRRTCGRGSAASSVVVYLLGITNVDPLSAHLLFERFLAPERIDPPDVDIDFAWDERDGVFSEILRDFGDAHVGLVATHLHLHGDGALREAARAHGLGDAAITAMSQRLQDLARYGVDRAGQGRATLPTAWPQPWPQILTAAAQLTGAPRHLGVHCGGVVITAQPLSSIVPVHPAAKHIPDPEAPAIQRAMPTIAWEKDGAEDLCLVKIDVLGNRSLAVIRDSIADLRAWGAFPAAYDHDDVWSQETQRDPATRDLLRSGATMGCFYIESPGMRQLQAKVGSGDFDRLIVHSSIIRPAGMDFIRTYIARHHVLHDPTLSDAEKQHRIATERWYPHPALSRLLSESYGVLSYQEDVMVVAQELAGFTSADANQLRKALGRNDTAERLAALVDRFVGGCRARGVDDETIRLVWRMISSFAGYSFAKAHSASYAVVSFHCAWLKAHHPAVFLARVIANEGGFYSASAYAEEARRLGITILPPCVVHGDWHTRAVAARSIRLGLQRVKGLGRAISDAIVRERSITPFAGVCDLLERTACDRDKAQALLDAGAFDVLLAGQAPAQRAWTTATAGRRKRTLVPSGAQQCLVLDHGPVRDPVPPPLPAADEHANRWRRFRCLGVLPDAHPLHLWRIRYRPALRARDLTPAMAKERVRLVGIAITRKDVNAITRDENDPHKTHVEDMAFVTLEDETALVETVWFPAVYRRHAVLLERGEPLLVTGVVDVDHGVVTLQIHSCAVCATALG